MAASEVDDGDLIDLGSGICISAVDSNSLIQVDPAVDGSVVASELYDNEDDLSGEQEHLLDVCPPRLEEKLSLSQKRELDVLRETEETDVLVTLGHDKVVPIAKRIDVVSSDTIKRVKDITKNLEPVIQGAAGSAAGIDIVDNGKIGETRDVDIFIPEDHSADTFETQEINNAFEFLTELDDCNDDDDVDDQLEELEYEDVNENENESREEDDEDDEELNIMNESISSDGPLIGDEVSLSNYPLEPTCYVETFGPGFNSPKDDKLQLSKSYVDSFDFSRSNFGGKKNDDGEKLIERSYSDNFNGDFENPAFEISPPKSKTIPRNFEKNSRKNYAVQEVEAIDAGAEVMRDLMNRERFLKSQSLRARKRSAENHEELQRHDKENIVNKCNNDKIGKSTRSKLDRKSWSEGTSVGILKPEFRTPRSTSFHIDTEEPSTSNEARTILQHSDVSIGIDNEEESSSSSSSSSSSLVSASEVSSEVDWSWVEEVESSRAKARVNEVEENIPTLKTELTGRMRPACNTACNSTDSIVLMSAVPAGKSSPVPAEELFTAGQVLTDDDFFTTSSLTTNSNSININNNNNSSNNNGNNNSSNTSWVRASMRRLRHLRLPEANNFGDLRDIPTSSNNSSVQISVPNSQLNVLQQTSAVLTTATATTIGNSLPDIALIAPEILAAQTNFGHSNSGSSNNINNNNNINININNLRPASAPTPRSSSVVGVTGVSTSPGRGRLHGGRSRGRNINNNNNQNQNSRRSSINSRNTPSDNSSCSTTSSGTSTATSNTSSPTNTPQHTAVNATSGRRVCERQRGADRDDERGEDDDEDENPLGRWPHALSPALACLGCTLGLFNISRFAILSIQFGANFIVQFLVLSLVLGIPLFTLQVCLGQRLAAGAVDMWKISPLFQGVGIALLTAQAFIGVYSIIGISWMFVYFRDSFITKQDRYRWAEPFLLYREDTKPMHNGTPYKLQETVPDYFSGAVLQRHHLNEPETGIVTLKFQVAFNLAVVWMIVFVSLSKGLRSYGKVVYVFTLVPVFGTLVLCAKLLGLTPTGSIHQLFPATVWNEFFTNGKSWMAASTEVFLTWGLFGAAAMQIAAHNKHKHLLQRDTSLVVVLTFVVLLLSAFLANTCVQILRHHGYIYTTSSFESISGYTFMHPVNQPVHPGQVSTPERFMNHASFLAGQRVVRHGADLETESGYQVLRLATELVPATLAMLGSEQVSPFWAVLFYFILILFGIAQQLAIWHCVITGIMAINTKMMKLWETTITFFSCACGYILGLPMATEFGIYVVYYLDYTVGGAWWILVLYLVEVGAVFAVRGRPHTGEAVVAELFPPTGRCLRHWAGPLLSFTWNVILPVALMVLSIMIFKSSGFRDLYTYRRTSRDYWSVWTRQLGAAIQLIPILMIPVVAVIQTCRYLNSGPPDIFDVRVRRIQLLYRPSLEPDDAADSQTQVGNDTTTSIHGNGVLPSTTDVPFEDPPPKYTPPPSYTTATGARIAKMLRQSFRRSVRRIANVLGESSTPRSRPALQPPPPDYAAVLVEMNQGIPSRDISIIVTEAGPDVTDIGNARTNSLERRRPNTIDRTMRISTIDRSATERTHSTMDRSRRTQTNNGSSNLTAADVANLLRSSIRRGTSRNQQSLHRSFTSNAPTAAVSIENLVEAAAPIGQDSLVLPKHESLVSEQDENDVKKTVDETENDATVI